MYQLRKAMKNLGMAKVLSLAASVLMLVCLLIGYVKVMASNDAERTARKAADLINAKASQLDISRWEQAEVPSSAQKEFETFDASQSATVVAAVESPVRTADQSAVLAHVDTANNASDSYTGFKLLDPSAAVEGVIAQAPISSVPVATSAIHDEQRGSANHQTFKLVDETGKSVNPSGIVQAGSSIYLLGYDCLWMLPGVVGTTKEPKPLSVKSLPVPGAKIKGIPIQEFLAACYYPPHKSVAVLDKSGSLFEFLTEKQSWNLLRANKQTLGSPDPHYVAITCDGTHLLLLDPERNQIWRFPSSKSDERYFREVLPWRIRAGDPNVADGIAIAFDGTNTLVLRRSGNISAYPPNSHGGNGTPRRLSYKVPKGVSPTRMSASAQGPVYVIERENNRVLAIDKKTGAVSQFLFPEGSDLRALLPGFGGYCVIDGDGLAFRMLKDVDAPSAVPHARMIDSRLKVLRIPIKGASLPRHPGVFPGARRLYRHGVHQGLDFFYDSGSGANVFVNTPAVAAASGKIIRADVNYQDMDARQYSKVMSDCAREQFCSEANEDLFRGCQVWIDHGGGLVTRYAHLNKARPDLRVGMPVQLGETIGYIGYSGTGENTAGRVKHPHLHFEVWLDGHYVGNGLTPSETIVMYQKIFPDGRRSYEPQRVRSARTQRGAVKRTTVPKRVPPVDSSARDAAADSSE